MTIVIGIVTAATHAYLPPELQNYLNSEGENLGTFDYVMLGLSVVMSIVLIVASFGLYSFRPWARTLFLGTNVFLLVPSLLSGPTVLSEWAAVVVYLDSILTGGILFTMYLPPIATLFEQNIIVPDKRN